MRKIPTIFERDWDGDRSRVLDQSVAGCEWVFAGEGIATQKLDGTACLIADGRLYRRHEVRPGMPVPEGFEELERDAETDKIVGWVPVGDGPEDRWHREAFGTGIWGSSADDPTPDGTYELLGPKIQGNPEGARQHVLCPHKVPWTPDLDAPRTFTGLAAFFGEHDDIEGIVWHHPDGRMAKIKARDFGLRRRPRA